MSWEDVLQRTVKQWQSIPFEPWFSDQNEKGVPAKNKK